jgi:hypothetical protein
MTLPARRYRSAMSDHSPEMHTCRRRQRISQRYRQPLRAPREVTINTQRPWAFRQFQYLTSPYHLFPDRLDEVATALDRNRRRALALPA